MNLTSWIIVLSFALSSSIDNFGVGITYGIRQIRVKFTANFIIAAIAFLFSETGIVCGKYISKVFPGTMSNLIGAIFIFVIGLRIVLLAVPSKRQKEPGNNPKEKAANFSGYLSSPERADFNQSGNIGFVEAIVLGIAVSMNALTNGLGAGLLGVSPLAISLSAAVFSFLSIWLGVKLGNKVANVRIGPWTVGQFSTALSGLILVLIALHNLL